MADGASGRDLTTAADMAAVLYWRLTAFTTPQPGPLLWLPDIPPTIRQHPHWDGYLTRRAQLVTHLAELLKDRAYRDTQPIWLPTGSRPNADLVADVAVWRAANGIHLSDPRPTGETQLQTAPDLWKQQLDRAIAGVANHSGEASGRRHTVGRPALSVNREHERHSPNGAQPGGPPDLRR